MSGTRLERERKIVEMQRREKTHDTSTLLFVNEVTAPDMGKCCFGFSSRARMKNSVKTVLSHCQSCFFSLILQANERKRVTFASLKSVCQKVESFLKFVGPTRARAFILCKVLFQKKNCVCHQVNSAYISHIGRYGIGLSWELMKNVSSEVITITLSHFTIITNKVPVGGFSLGKLRWLNTCREKLIRK